MFREPPPNCGFLMFQRAPQQWRLAPPLNPQISICAGRSLIFGLLLDLAITQRDGAVGEFSPPRIMAHDDHGSPLLINLIPKDFADVFSSLGVERSRWLVCEKDRGISSQGPRYGDSLLFSRAQFVGFLMKFIAQPELKKQLTSHFHTSGLARIANFKADCHVVQRR